ncbi:hypothetical protein SPLA10_PHROGS00087 [Salmonella phage SPLA10]|nr:hypothetical protein SPLA10_PHROGS00087 [Salmonella phage SPLA10]
MLSKHSIRVAKAIAAQTQVSLESDFNLFSNAVVYSTPVLRGSDNNVSLESIGDEVQSAADVVISSDSMSQHEEAVNGAVDVLLVGITNQFEYVRSTVRPFISTTTDRLLTRLKSSTPAEYSLREFEISDFLTSEVAERLFKDVPMSKYYKVAREGACKETEQILQDIATNIPEIDAAVAEIVGRLGNQAVADIFAALFAGKRPDDNSEVTDMIRRLIVKDGTQDQMGVFSLDEVDFLLCAYFIAEGYLDNPVDGTGLSMEEYSTYVKQLMNNIGGSIARLVGQYQQDVQDNVLYLRKPRVRGIFFDHAQGEILVLKPIARLAFEKGLVAEQIIGGAIHPSKNIFRLTDLLPIKEECLRIYQSMDQAREEQTRLTIVDRINDALKIVLTTTLEELPDDSFPADFDRQAAVANIAKVTDVLKVYFAKWDSSEEVRIYDLMTRVICQIVFPFTDAQCILETMEEIVAEEDIEPRYAAYYAMITYMTRWMVANYHIGTDE